MTLSPPEMVSEPTPALKLWCQVGMFGNSHDDDGRIKNLRPFERVGDLDQCLG